MTGNKSTGTKYSGSKKRGSGRKNQKRRRVFKKALSAILLVLMILAFIVIQKRESEGTLEASGLAQTQEGAAKTDSPESVQTEIPEDVQAQSPEQVPADLPDQDQSEKAAGDFSLDMVPPYSGQAYADINGDVPFFTDEEMTSEAFHEYWPLDELGRCTGAYACVGPETLPKQKRGDISSVKPAGWNTNRYSDIDGEMLFNRCHMIGHMLTGQDANERNLVTGTRYMNTEGMLPFEESVLMYVEGTGHHVMYRVRPYFDGDNLVCDGVLMEARSVEDPLVQFCAFCYNVQPGFEIDYATGDNRRETSEKDDGVKSITTVPSGQEGSQDESVTRQMPGDETAQESTTETAAEPEAAAAADTAEEAEKGFHYVLNTNTHKFHMPYCDSVYDIKDKNKQESTLDRDTLIEQGYSPCKRCNP